MTLRIQSPLSDEIDLMIERIIGCAIEVHRRLGPGFVEGIYEDAMTIELEAAGLTFDRQPEIVVHYRNKPLRPQRIDLVVERQIVVEVKAVEQLHSLHRAQLLSYLRSTGLPVGLLINFNGEVLKGNIKRVVM